METFLKLKGTVSKVLGRSSPVNHGGAMVIILYFNIQNILCSQLGKN